MRRVMTVLGMSLVAPALAQAASKAPATAAAAPLPSEITYRGEDRLVNGKPDLNWAIQMKIADGKITGSAHTSSIDRRQSPSQAKVTGTFRNGQCTINAGGLTLSGLCNNDQFTGIQMIGTKTYGSFTFYNILTEDRQLAARGPVKQQSTTDNSRASPKIFNMDLPDTTGRTGTHGAENGWFDYVEGDDAPDAQAGHSGDGYADNGDGSSADLPAPAGTVWAYGRNRWVIQPGGRCGLESQLVKGYCFGAVTGYMCRNPKVKSVVAITLSHPTPPGTWISNDTPIRYGYIEVYRNKDGNGFHADKHLTGTAKVKTPMGCHFSPLKEGFVLAAPGPQGLQEAALFRCP